MDDDADIFTKRKFLVTGTWNNATYAHILTASKQVTVDQIAAYMVRWKGPEQPNDYVVCYELTPGSYSVEDRARPSVTRSNKICILRLE